MSLFGEVDKKNCYHSWETILLRVDTVAMDPSDPGEKLTTTLELCRECDARRLVTRSAHCYHSWERIHLDTSSALQKTTVEICRECGLQRRVVATVDEKEAALFDLEVEFSVVELP